MDRKKIASSTAAAATSKTKAVKKKKKKTPEKTVPVVVVLKKKKKKPKIKVAAAAVSLSPPPKKTGPFVRPGQPSWKKLFNEIWHQIRLRRTSGPTIILTTPFMHVDVNKGKFGGKYDLILQCESSPDSPQKFTAAIFTIRSKKLMVEIHHTNGVVSGEENVEALLAELGDSGFDPFGKDSL